MGDATSLAEKSEGNRASMLSKSDFFYKDQLYIKRNVVLSSHKRKNNKVLF